MRYLEGRLLKDLKDKMVFLSGPRQSGKTTLARQVLMRFPHAVYLNWDDAEDRKRIRSHDWADDTRLVVLDELHKFSKWKNWLKGLFDKTRDRTTYLITGSARLDVYKRGGDSMLGRYFPWRLHPFCLAERPSEVSENEAFERLLRLGGFPEPFLSGDADQARRWRRVRRDLILQQDLRDLSRVEDLAQIDALLELLSQRVGGPAVVANLARDLDAAPKTVRNWLRILSSLYMVFPVKPYSRKIGRAIKKAEKYYFFDNADVIETGGSGALGARFENLVASHLLKRLHFLEDSTGHRYELAYVRDNEGHEVDFVVVKDRNPVALIEAKESDEAISPSLHYFGERLKVRNRIQLVARPTRLKREELRNGVALCPAVPWLSRPLEGPEPWEVGRG